MKKIYSKPAMRGIQLHGKCQLLSGSGTPTAKTHNSYSNGASYARGNAFWDDDDEE